MPDILSQDEVDALLAAIQKGEVDVAEQQDEQSSAQRKVEPYDFHKPHLISNEQLRGLQIIHDTFAKGVQSNLSGLLRTAIEVKLVAIDQLLYSEFILSLYNPTFLSVINAPPLTGTFLVEMNLPIVMIMIDRLLGGLGQTVPAPRELTAIEVTIVNKVVRAVLDELRLAWGNTVENIEFELESHDFNPEFLRVAPPEASVLSVTLDWRFGETAGVMNLCYPFSMIKPMLSKLTAETLISKAPKEASVEERKKMAAIIKAIPVHARAILGRSVLSANQVADLKVGDIVCLQNRFDEPVELAVDGRPCFKAEIGRSRGKIALRLLQPILSENGKT